MTRYRLLGVALFFVCIYSIPAELSPLNYLKVGMKISTAKQLLVEDNWVAVQLNIRINPETVEANLPTDLYDTPLIP